MFLLSEAAYPCPCLKFPRHTEDVTKGTFRYSCCNAGLCALLVLPWDPPLNSVAPRAEAAAVEKVVTHFLRGRVAPDQVGIITPYEGQRAHVLQLMQRSGALAASVYAQARASDTSSGAQSLREPCQRHLAFETTAVCSVGFQNTAGCC